jgi:hypothetical protein
MGIPNEPGGSLLDGLVLLSRKRIGISKRRATRRKLVMIQDFVFLVLEYPDISFKIKHGINSFMLNPLFLANKCTLDPIPRLMYNYSKI